MTISQMFVFKMRIKKDILPKRMVILFMPSEVNTLTLEFILLKTTNITIMFNILLDSSQFLSQFREGVYNNTTKDRQSHHCNKDEVHYLKE